MTRTGTSARTRSSRAASSCGPSPSRPTARPCARRCASRSASNAPDGPPARPSRSSSKARASAGASEPLGDSLAVSFADGTLRVYGPGGDVRRAWKSGEKGFVALSFSGDGRRLVGGGSDGRVSVAESGAGRELGSFAAHTAKIDALAVSRDGSVVATAAGSEAAAFRTADGTRLFTVASTVSEVTRRRRRACGRPRRRGVHGRRRASRGRGDRARLRDDRRPGHGGVLSRVLARRTPPRVRLRGWPRLDPRRGNGRARASRRAPRRARRGAGVLARRNVGHERRSEHEPGDARGVGPDDVRRRRTSS